MSYKKWVLSFIITLIFLFIISFSITLYIDPFFVYQKPNSNISYLIDDSRYQTMGIVRKFDYDAILTGSSIISNFSTSEFDSLFSTKSIKVNIPGSTFVEIKELLEEAFHSNSNIKVVFRSLDTYCLGVDSYYRRYTEESFPYYLYDNSLLNDYPYFINKKILFDYSLNNINRKIHGIESTSFDDFNKDGNENYSESITRRSYTRPFFAKVKDKFTDEVKEVEKENLEENFIHIIQEHPETEFYLFYQPSNILYWDKMLRMGRLELVIEQSRYAASLLLEYDNVYLYSFFQEHDIIENLNNYKDYNHFSADVSSNLLHRISEGLDELNIDNYQEYFDELYKYYSSYDYDSLFQ